MKTLIIVTDKLSEARFSIFEDTYEAANNTLISLGLDLEEFEVLTLNEGVLFDYYEQLPVQETHISPQVLLKELIDISRRRNEDAESKHEDADKAIIKALGKEYKIGISLFDNMEKWYA